MHHDQLFLQPGLRSEIILIRDWLDTGKIQNLNISNFPRNFFYLEMEMIILLQNTIRRG